MKTKIFTFIVLVSLFANCKKEKSFLLNDSGNETNQINALQSTGISVENNYLYFRNLNSFYQTMEKLSTYNESQKDGFEGHFSGFTSRRKQYNNNSISDSLFFYNLSLTNYPESNPDNIEHCPEIMETMYMYDKHYLGTEYNNYLLLHNLTNKYTSVANTKGLFRIGDSLIFCLHDTIKILSPVDQSKIQLLLGAISDDNINGIHISNSIINKTVAVEACNPVPPSYFSQYPWGYLGTGYPSGSVTFSTSGKLCIYMIIWFNNAAITSCPSYFEGAFHGHIKCTKRNSFGSWVDDAASVTLELYYNTTLTFPYMPSQGLIYSGYGITHTIDNLPGTKFIQQNAWDYPVGFNITSFHARATRTGGSSGGEINLYH